MVTLVADRPLAGRDAQSQIAYLKGIIAAREKELAYIKALLASPKFDASTKLFILTQRRYEQTEMPNEDGLWRINMQARAAEMGMDPSAASRKAQILAENDLLEHSGPIPVVKKNDDEVTLVFGSLDLRIKTLEGLQSFDDTKLRPWGGDHKSCSNIIDGKPCSGHLTTSERATRKQKITKCDTCHEVIIYPEKEHLAPLQPGAYDQNGRRKTQDQVDPERESESEPDKVVQDQVDPENNLHASGPSNPRPPMSEQLDPEELERAIALYLDIAGDLPFHIKMGEQVQTTGEWPKYKDQGRPLTPGHVRLHSLGHQTYGAACCNQDGTTRIDVWDADTEANCTIAREAARLLSASGYAVFIEEPPQDRPGGHPHSIHLLTIYKERHDKRATLAAALALAPELEKLEHWPTSGDVEHSTKVRLPGGKYVVRNDDLNYREWCTLANVATSEATTNGAAMARMLLANQTPASLIPPLPVVDRESPPQNERPSRGALLGIPSTVRPSRSYSSGDDVIKAAIAQFEAVTSWQDVFSPWSLPDRYGAYRAMRSGGLETEASIKPNLRGCTYSDYGCDPVVCGDKVRWWCRVRGIDERAFKSGLCADYRKPASRLEVAS